MLPFAEEEPTYDEGRTLMDGRKLDSEGKIEPNQEPTPDAAAQKASTEPLIAGSEIEEDEEPAQSAAAQSQQDVMQKFSAGLSSWFSYAKTKAN